MESDYFPTALDMEVYTAGTKVLDLDFSAQWQYMAAMDDVVPKILELNLVLDPFTITVTNAINETAFTIDYSMSFKENQETKMSFDALLTFTDGTMEEISEMDLDYMFGVYLVSFWADAVSMETLMESDTLTLDEVVAELNTEEYMYCHIFESDVLIGQLKAKKVWYEEYQEYDIVPYIEFIDGSTLDEEILAAMFGDMGMGK